MLNQTKNNVSRYAAAKELRQSLNVPAGFKVGSSTVEQVTHNY